MPYQFTQTGQEIQDILDQVPTNTADISSLNATLTQLSTALNPTALSFGTRGSSFTNGAAWYLKVGKLVFGALQDLTCAADQATHGTIIFSGLPPAKTYTLFIINQQGAAPAPCRVGVNTSGQIVIHYGTVKTGSQYYAMFHYLAA